MDHIKRALGALAPGTDATRNTEGSSACLGQNSTAACPTDQVGPDGKRRCIFFDEERTDPHPECCKCGHILKKPPPCMCDLCHALNFPVPSRTTTPDQGAAAAAAAAGDRARQLAVPQQQQQRQTGRDAAVSTSLLHWQAENAGEAPARLQPQSSSSNTSSASAVSSVDWVRVDLARPEDGALGPDDGRADDDSKKPRTQEEETAEASWRARRGRAWAPCEPKSGASE